MGRRSLVLVVALVVAALGTALVFLYASNADQRALAGQETVEVLVAKSEIPAGVSGADASERGLFEAKVITADSAAEGVLSPADLGSIADSVAVTTIYTGEQIVAAKFGAVGEAATIPMPAGSIALSVDLPYASQAAGFVRPGSEVAVFNTADDSTGLIVQRALVVAVGQTAANATETEQAEVPRTVLTLAVAQADAQKIIYAANNGTVDVALVNSESKIGPAPLTNDGNVWA